MNATGRLRPIYACSAIVLLVAPVAIVVGLRIGSHRVAGLGEAASRRAPVALPRPRTISSGGREYRVHQVRLVAVLPDQANTRMLRVPIFEHADTHQPACAQLSTSVRVVRQTATSVAIAAFGYSAMGLPRQSDCFFATTKSKSLYAPHSVSLRRPLGARAVVDARTGERLAVLTPELEKKPTYVPTGYRSGVHEGFTQKTGFAALEQYVTRSGDIEITAHSGRWPDRRDGVVESHPTVNGHRATVSYVKHQRCLTWSDQPGLYRQVCSIGATSTLPASELLKIADSLR